MWIWGLCLLLIGVLAELSSLPDHVKMCLVSGSIFVVLKAESLRAFLASGVSVSVREKFLWFAAWPGFDTAGFLTREATSRPTRAEWTSGTIKAVCGLALWLLAAPAALPRSMMVAGWLAMIGIVLAMHFGGLHLLALFWRARGRDVRPIMNAPALTKSLSEFWGRRWNMAFRNFAHHAVFKPAARRWNAAAGTWISFVFSGLVHELAISVPAGDGYGLPLAYFVLQGFGVSLERTLSRKSFTVRGGLPGWSFAALFLIPAAVFLFHPPFVRNVVVPLIPH